MRTATAVILLAAITIAAEAGTPAPAGVLILADSNGEGHFGATLYNGFRAMRDPVTGTPLQVLIFAKCGAGAIDFVNREWARIDCTAWRCGSGRAITECKHFDGGYIPELSDLFRDLNAERRVTVVALGLNMLFGNRKGKMAQAAALIAKLKAQGSACIWVGPPQAGDGFVPIDLYGRFEADLKATVTRHGCRYISSDDKTDRRVFGSGSKNDHYDKSGSIAWAGKVLRESEAPLKAALRDAR